jgi:hypothetical protein
VWCEGREYLIGMILAKAKIDIKNLRDPLPRAVPKAAVPRGMSVLGSRYALLLLFWLNRKVRKLLPEQKKVTRARVCKKAACPLCTLYILMRGEAGRAKMVL